MSEAPNRVLFVLPTLGGGGAERVFITLLRHLDRTRFEPHLAVLAQRGAYVTDVPEDVPVHNLNVFRVRYCLPGLVRLIRRLRPPAVLSTPRELNLALISAGPLLPQGTRLFVREAAPVANDIGEKSRFPAAWRRLCQYLYPKPERLICVSTYVADDLASLGIPRAKLVRIYNPVDIDAIRRRATGSASPYPASGPHFVAAGRMTREKGFDVLLESMSLVGKRVPGARLTLLGAGPLAAELRAQRDELGLANVVDFAGFQSNPYPYFKHAHALILSSRYEGLPGVVLEALALGTKVIAADCPGGVREILDGCRRSVLVPRLDANLLAEAILSACQDEGRGAIEPIAGDDEAVLDRFRVERIVREYEDLLLS